MTHEKQFTAEVLRDPLRFIKLCWPWMMLTQEQNQVLLSVKDHPETFVHAANKMGKTRIAALITLWFFVSRSPVRVLLSSSSEKQLTSVLWRELEMLIHTSALPFPLRINQLKIQKTLGGGSSKPQDFIQGHVTNAVEHFQGHHLPDDIPSVLVVFDEASGIGDEYYEAADSWAHRKLVIGNPLSTDNFFYRLCKAGDTPDPAGEANLLRKVIHIDARNSPNVIAGVGWCAAGRQGPPPTVISGLLTYADFLRHKQEWDEVQLTTRLYGLFYLGEDAFLFPVDRLDRLMDPKLWSKLKQTERRAEAMGVDVAAGGRDNTCWTLVDHLGLIKQIVLDTSNTMEIPGRTIQLMRDYQLDASQVAMDAGGGGKQIADRLHEQGHYVLPVAFGEGPSDKQAYKNRRGELYGVLREWLNPDREGGPFALPPNAHALRQELAVLPLQHDSEGRLQLPPKNHDSSGSGKKTIRQLLGRSPDRADSLALAVWVLKLIQGQVAYQGTGHCSPGTPEEMKKRPTIRQLADMRRHGRQLSFHERICTDEYWGDA